MFKRKQLYQAVAAALLLAAGASNPALAVDEVEPNNQIFNLGELTAQPLTIGADGTVEVKGAIGVTGTADTPVADVDFYAFKAQAGDEVKINIDCGIKRNRIRAGGTELVCIDPTKPRSVDTVLALFGPLPNTDWIRMNDNTERLVPPLDDGSADTRDARIDGFKVPENGTGIYVVGVSSAPRLFLNGGRT